MAKPAAVKRLADDLIAQDIESKYLARVLERVSQEQQLDNLRNEIAREIAQALGRSEDRVNLALAELELLRARYERARAAGEPESELKALVRAHDAQRAVAKARLHELLIHREAIGFRRNQLLYELYPIPLRLEPTCRPRST
jgi:hypothetical protein